MNKKNQPPPRKPMYPRDGPGRFTVPATKGGSIQRLVGLRDFMEIYTEHETFRFKTPESIDPERTNPNAMFVQTKVAEVGTSSPYVARTIVMAHDMVSNGTVVQGEALVGLLVQMHRVKETLLHCAHAAETFRVAYEAEIEKVKQSGGKLAAGGQMLDYFPVVQDIDAKVTSFLTPARRAITEICQIPETFWTFKRQHSDPAHLVEKELIPLLGANHRMVEWLKTRLQMIKAIIDFRNGQEHATTTKGAKLVVKNFELMPNNQISVPSWGLDGGDLTAIGVDLVGMMDFLVGLAEVMFVACIDANLPTFPPMQILRVENPDQACPIRYVLKIDEKKILEQMKKQGVQPGSSAAY